MRLSFPMRVSLPKTVAFAAGLLCVEQLEHTKLAFSLLVFMFIVVSAVTFNLAGGFSRASGAYVCFFSVLCVVLGVICKALVGEPADSNLEAPLVTMGAYASGILMMMLVIVLNQKLTGGVPGVGLLLGSSRLNLTYCGMGCMIAGFLMGIADVLVGAEPGSILSALNQINFLLPLGIILVTVDLIQKSGGRVSLNAMSAACMLFSFLLGLVGFSKQGMFTPFAAWTIGALYGRLRLRWVHVVSGVGFAALAFFVLTPVSEIGRDTEAATISGRLFVAYDLIQNLGATRALYTTSLSADQDSNLRHGYFSTSLGLAERLTMIVSDDGLIAYTERGKPLGYAPIRQFFGNWIPHFLAPNKTSIYNGNYYAHEIGGILAPDDTTTGISFGPIGEAFHLGGWAGIFLLAPAVWLILFATTDLVCGDLRRSPWGLVAVLIFGHIAPEGGLGGAIYFTWYLNLGIVALIFFCVYLAPILGRLFGGAERTAPGRASAAMGRSGLA